MVGGCPEFPHYLAARSWLLGYKLLFLGDNLSALCPADFNFWEYKTVATALLEVTLRRWSDRAGEKHGVVDVHPDTTL